MSHHHLQRRLLAWFSKNARAMPWRRERDAYRIWISEVMLQQTQVATVIPFYERFMQRFPTLHDLAQAEEEDVLRLWEGLGYYRRARALWQSARLLREKGYTTLPDDPDLVATLPGFGRYTVGAVLSQAYERRLPIVEANSQRVLCRLFGIDDDPSRAAVKNRLWKLAESLLPLKSSGNFNQAMMELGAVICTPMKPQCGACPIRRHCTANQQDRQEGIPFKARAETIENVNEVAIVVRRSGRWLIGQRPDGGRWARMWEFPHHPLGPGETPQTAAYRLLAALGLDAEVGPEMMTIRHSVTRFRISMTCFLINQARGQTSRGDYTKVRWVRSGELADLPLSTPQRRLARRLLEIDS